nr:DTW domain-containing protein [Variovorax sp. N23]
MPRLALRNLPPSRYRIRKARGPEQLSTREATCYALCQLEGGAERFQPLPDAFDGFVESWSRLGASETRELTSPVLDKGLRGSFN